METTTPTEATPAAPAVTPLSPPSVEEPIFPPGTKLREYETIYAVKPDLGDDVVDKFKERMRGLVTREGGKAIKFTIWGKKKTQYEVKKQLRAIYTHMLYLGPAKLVAEVERNLRNDESVIRYQTVKISEETDAAKPVEQDVKLAGDVEAPERPPREERERRDDFADIGEGPEADDGPRDFADVETA